MNAGIRTIKRIPVGLVVVHKHARNGTRVIRPAFFENALVFVLPQDPGLIGAFCNPDNDFISLRESSAKWLRMNAKAEIEPNWGP